MGRNPATNDQTATTAVNARTTHHQIGSRPVLGDFSAAFGFTVSATAALRITPMSIFGTNPAYVIS
jgi:hypothetical protein